MHDWNGKEALIDTNVGPSRLMFRASDLVLFILKLDIAPNSDKSLSKLDKVNNGSVINNKSSAIKVHLWSLGNDIDPVPRSQIMLLSAPKGA